ncbi:glycosyltransferase [Roseiconus lacunae]|uniref:Glycosyltransferase n=1 Tax=Roseiconus lacunae TaxID=2605694 RepID=A0ABT7PQQ5_9BACT|nr:glycosyltransferase [Roseiconus lacunae]MDM4018840.1 glycosyltransferase [Roseiconus lacunae]
MKRTDEFPMVLHARGITGAGGGPEKTIANSPRFLSQFGYRCVCAYMHPPGDPGFDLFLKKAQQAGTDIIELLDRKPLDFALIRQYVQLCKMHQVDIWHAHDYKTDVLGLLVRRFWPMKLVTTVHGWVQITPRTKIYYAIDRRILRFYQHVIAVSDDLHDECLQYGVKKQRLTLIRNAIDTLQFRPSEGKDQRQSLFAVPEESFVIGAVGRLSPEKGFDVLIHCVDQLVRRGRNVHLLIAGEGPERETLRSQIESLGLQNSITLLGQISEMIPLFSSLDTFVLSSYREGLPNVVLEAMAMKVPVVSTRVAGIPHLITDEQSGLLIDAGSVEQLTRALERVLDSPELRESMASNGRQVIEREFDFANRMRRVVGIYDKVLGRNDNAVGASVCVASRGE